MLLMIVYMPMERAKSRKIDSEILTIITHGKEGSLTFILCISELFVLMTNFHNKKFFVTNFFKSPFYSRMLVT